jgi:hypothetical protein
VCACGAGTLDGGHGDATLPFDSGIDATFLDVQRGGNDSDLAPDTAEDAPHAEASVDGSEVDSAVADVAVDSSPIEASFDGSGVDSAAADVAVDSSPIEASFDGSGVDSGVADVTVLDALAHDADAGDPPVSCGGPGDPARACGSGDSLPPWTYDVTYGGGGGGAACATLGADAGAPSCVACSLSYGTDSPQCAVPIAIAGALWSLAYDPVSGYVYVTEMASSCPSNGGWTPRCEPGDAGDAGQDCTTCYHNNPTNVGCPGGYTANQCPCSCFTPGSSDSVTSCGPTGCSCVSSSSDPGQSCIVSNPETCTSFTYSAWGACQADGTQTRTVVSSSPAGCVGGSPVLSQSCTPTCTSFTYSAWGSCQPDDTQTRTVVSSSPAGCAGGTPVLSQSCTYAVSCSGSPASLNETYGWTLTYDGTQTCAATTAQAGTQHAGSGCASGTSVTFQDLSGLSWTFSYDPTANTVTINAGAQAFGTDPCTGS